MSQQCALWWWSHGAVDVKVFDTEAAAVRYGLGIEDDDSGSVAGVQFPDGQYVERDEWTSYGDEWRRRLYAWRDVAVQSSAPSRLVTAPWGDDVVGVDADLPAWVGLPENANDPASREASGVVSSASPRGRMRRDLLEHSNSCYVMMLDGGTTTGGVNVSSRSRRKSSVAVIVNAVAGRPTAPQYQQYWPATQAHRSSSWPWVHR